MKNIKIGAQMYSLRSLTQTLEGLNEAIGTLRNMGYRTMHFRSSTVFRTCKYMFSRRIARGESSGKMPFARSRTYDAKADNGTAKRLSPNGRTSAPE